MVDAHSLLDVYKIPSNEIIEKRREFYGSLNRIDKQTSAWLKQVQQYLCRFDYPPVIMEFLLFDRFICGLNATELRSIESVSESWTFKQLWNHYFDGNLDTKPLPANLMAQIENVSMDVVKTEPVC